MFIMKIFLLLFCTTAFSLAPSATFSQNEKVTIASDKTMTIYEVLELIGKQTECTFIYQSDIFKDVPDISLTKGVIKVKALLQQYLPESDYTITTTNDTYITISKKVLKPTKQRQIEVKGQITDTEGLPISGAFISIKGSHKGTTSLIDGTYSINASADDILVFSYLGFLSQTIPVDGQQEINVQLQDDVTAFDAVILNAGYYSVKESESTGSIVKVTQKDIEQQPISNPLAALQGRVSGVEIVQTSGVAGAGFDIKIRGQNSIRSTGNQPLYVIDGVPYSSSSLGEQQASIIIPGTGISPLNNINPTDIESIEILKDADATAIYGSRGANGVVLITTKKGKYGATKVQLNISSGLGVVSNTLDLLNTSEYLTMRREAFANDGIDPIPFYAYDVNGVWDQNRETDWQKALFGKASYLTNFQGSISGGNEQTQFLLSGNVHEQTSTFPGDYKNDKISALANVKHHTKNNKLSLQLSSNYTSNLNNLPSDPSLIFTALSLAPNAPNLYTEDGALNWENSTWINPLSGLESNYNSQTSTLITNATISYKLLETLNINTNLGFTEDHLRELNTVPSTIYDPAYGLGAESSYAIHNVAQRTSWIVEPQLNWSHTLKDTKIESLAGFTFQEQNDNRLSHLAFGFSNNNFIENISAASEQYTLADIQTTYRYQAIFGRINLNHYDKYFLNFTGRRDGSSRFGPHKRFANFGAIGAAWIFSNEHFLEDLDFLSFGKLRASYGTSGNDQIGDYQYLDTYSFGSGHYQNTIGLMPSRLFNPDFSWEANTKFEVALELGVLQDRLFISGNYYRNRSSNQLVGLPLPATTGFPSINANLNATVENSGWEFLINTINIHTDTFKWSTSFNLTVPKNRLIAFPNLEGSTYANQLVIGEPLNIIKAYQLNGVNSETGLYEFEDFNGDGIISAQEDKQLIKDLSPQFYGGFSNNLTYGKFNLDILFQFTKQLGRNYWSTGGAIVGAMANQPKEVLDRWQHVGDESSVQRFTTGLDPEGIEASHNFTESDGAISDASYLRLKTLSLSYTLSQNEKNGIGCELFLRAQNLWTLTNYIGLDPETTYSATLPPLRFITLGTRLTF
ncbi:TonB-linked SusC/RagA family outer membrane protein [Winogradskyella pacifica]|uniref:TonB-linked SusC/RagA family outer membrane protein n=2 Tax=Winogradskyella pacifica TaxID=664642 RepID=A0A3D9LK85_9FLAO|nr:TonB-linked SusC/RagA family outer membrane protein [Winogradskyella pacifica]